MSSTLTDIEFNELLVMTKHFVDGEIKLPSIGDKASYRLIGDNPREIFSLDINRSGVLELNKFTIQNRYSITPLVRLDIDSAPHINPDGSTVSRNHIHIYKENFGDSWAYELDEVANLGIDDCHTFDDYLIEFCSYCNIVLPETQSAM